MMNKLPEKIPSVSLHLPSEGGLKAVKPASPVFLCGAGADNLGLDPSLSEPFYTKVHPLPSQGTTPQRLGDGHVIGRMSVCHHVSKGDPDSSYRLWVAFLAPQSSRSRYADCTHSNEIPTKASWRTSS